MVPLIPPFALSWLIGLCIVVLCFRESILLQPVLKLFLGLGAGFGITSCLYFAWSLLFNPSNRVYFIVEGILLVLLLFFVIRDQTRRVHPPVNSRSKSIFQTVLIAVLAAVFLAVLWNAADAFYHLILNEPHGRYDAWAIWSYRARFIFRGGENWLDAVSPLQFHPDYPLLVPLSISRVWLFAGMEIQKAVIILAGLFTFGSIGLLLASLAQAKKFSQGMIAAVILGATTTFIYNGSILFADVPQSFYILAAVAVAYSALQRDKANTGLILLAGFFTGYCGWVKNEGLMFMAISVTCALVFLLLFNRERKKAFLSWYFIGLAIPLITILFFKGILSPENDLVNPQNMATIFDKLFDPLRYGIIYGQAKIYFEAFGGWTFPLLLGIFIYTFVTFKGFPPGQARAFWAVAAMLILQLFGYTLIYVITPFDLATHVRQSIMRLIIHIYPAVLFCVFLLTKSPEEILAPIFQRRQMESKKSDP